MRRNGTLHQLIGDGQLDEQDLEAEWQHKLETSPDWQEKMDKMTSHQKKNFLRHRRDAFVEVIRKAFARAQAKVDAGRLVPAHDGSKDSAPSSEVGDEDEGNELTGALTKFRQDRLRELDGFQQEPSHEISRAPTTFVHQGLSEKECEALALAMFQQNRMRRDNPNQELGSQERVEAQAPARGAEECKQQSGGSKGNLLHLVLRRRKKERKLDADQKEFESKKEALGDASASSVWQAVKNFGNYSKCCA